MELFDKENIFQQIEKFLRQSPNGVLEILGATASGKTDFSIQVAHFLKEKLNKESEIISVDSKQIYRDINISSAKITPDEMEGIIHHGIDIINPDEPFSVVQWQKYCCAKIEEIQARGNVPILAGGTMLWLDAVSENYDFPDDPAQKSTSKLPPLWDFLKIGIYWDRQVLYDRINKRAIGHFESGLIEETKVILEKYKMTRNSFTSFGYAEIKAFFDGEVSRDEALARNQQRNRKYAKRQLTWWRGREDVVWANGSKLFNLG